ncbi:hypothetical protein C2E20_3647 [Micractinium conductrix]|uniref:Uncharacterized protein n=1 Tax=Micractinium conductrix TaxID=554055 RepID=A0A2P6VG32_9CHLO|nr:hypothetical protein C2E20_3647 [Micractinium conductrix]|eukprot:PSC73050.1 hypothetical protein C2E20_3647 [Micractinium conductrix]
MLLNAGTGAVASRRAARTHNRVAAGGVLAAAWQRPPPPPSPPLGRKRRSPSPPAPPLPPSPPAPPPAFCDVAPSHLARWRFSNLSAVFPAKPEHYSANLVARHGDGGRMPSYYNGVVPRNCLVGIQATYTCMQDDNPCNYSPTVSSSYCQTACNNDAQDCSQVAGLEGHPLAARACGLFRRSQPACTHIGFTLNREQQLRAFYKLNLCMAPPGPRPLPPATPPPPPPPAEYYYV